MTLQCTNYVSTFWLKLFRHPTAALMERPNDEQEKNPKSFEFALSIAGIGISIIDATPKVQDKHKTSLSL
jgi:hypothetical protein